MNSFTLTPKQWIASTQAIGLSSKAGRYGGTYAHKDIALEFASWVSVEFKLYLIKEFQRLKEAEYKQLGWDVKRQLTKINYRIHTDAVKENLKKGEPQKSQKNAENPCLFFLRHSAYSAAKNKVMACKSLRVDARDRLTR